MKKLFMAGLVLALLSCNNSAVVNEKTDLDRTDNDDTVSTRLADSQDVHLPDLDSQNLNQ